MRPPTLTAVVIISLCSACSPASPGVKTPIPANANEVVITDYKFVPPVLTVGVGTIVTWINRDVAPHTATHRSFGDEPFDSGSLGHLAVYSHTFKTAGSYDYLCILHQGMIGTIVVH